MPPTSQSFQVFPSGELGKIGACEGTQAVLAIPLYRLFLTALINTGFFQKKVGITFTVFEKINSFFEEGSHRGNITFSIIATGNQTAEGGET